jgi:hypothetical protein
MIKRLAMAIAVLSFCAAILVTGRSGAFAQANNGTLKIHEKGTASGTESNDPKVCIFNLEGFGFDAAQTGYINIDVQGGSSPVGENAGPFIFGPTNADGYYATMPYFNDTGGATIKNGTYKATLYGKDTGGNINLQDEKAKSKVFKVDCAPGQGGETPPVTPPPTTTGGQGGETGAVLGAATTAIAAGGQGAVAPAELPNTGLSDGMNPWIIVDTAITLASGLYWRKFIQPLIGKSF